MPTKRLLLHKENAPTHKSLVAMAAKCYWSFELIKHPSYSSDLAVMATTDLCLGAFFLLKQSPFCQLTKPFWLDFFSATISAKLCLFKCWITAPCGISKKKKKSVKKTVQLVSEKIKFNIMWGDQAEWVVYREYWF